MVRLRRNQVDQKEQHHIIITHVDKKQNKNPEGRLDKNKKQSKGLKGNLNLKGTHSRKPQKFSPNLKMNRRNLQTRGR